MSAEETSCGIRAARCDIKDKMEFLGRIREIAQRYDLRIICFNADMMAGRRHAEAAVRLAVRSFRTGSCISNTLEMEALLYAAGSRQCHVAVSFGPHTGDNHLWICCYPEHGEAWRALETLVRFQDDDSWEQIDAEKRTPLMRHFAITPEECDTLDAENTLTDLVVERVALLPIVR